MKKVIAILCSGIIATGCIVDSADAAKKWTITQRQVELRKKVAKGQKANELTLKESEKFNNRLDEIASDIDKFKAKNGGKLSYKDEGKIEKRLNNLSVDIQKAELNKRTVAK